MKCVGAGFPQLCMTEVTYKKPNTFIVGSQDHFTSKDYSSRKCVLVLLICRLFIWYLPPRHPAASTKFMHGYGGGEESKSIVSLRIRRTALRTAFNIALDIDLDKHWQRTCETYHFYRTPHLPEQFMLLLSGNTSHWPANNDQYSFNKDL